MVRYEDDNLFVCFDKKWMIEQVAYTEDALLLHGSSFGKQQSRIGLPLLS